MEQEKKTAVEMTAQEAAEFAAFRAEQERKSAEAKRKADRETYNILVDETIDQAMPVLQSISEGIAIRRSNELRIKLLVAENPPEEQKEAFPSIKVIV